MRLGIKHIAFALLVLCVFASGGLWASDESSRIQVDGDRLSVHAEGIGLGNLLSAVGDMTGIRFRFDESVMDKKVYVDFEGLPLAKAIKKIIHPLNFATIYDDTGKLCKVIILERWMGSPLNVHQEEENDAAQGPQPTPSNRMSSTPKENFVSPAASKQPPLGKQGNRFQGFSRSETPSVDGPPKDQGQAMEGPPVGKAYSMTGPPDTPNQNQDGPPDSGTSGPPATRDSKDSPVDGPPLDKPYSVDGPPDGRDKVMERPPGSRGS